MKVRVWKVISAIVLTLAVLFFSRQIQSHIDRPIEITAKTGAFTMQHTASSVHAGKETSPLFTVRVSGPNAPGTFKVFLMYRPEMESKKNIAVRFIRQEAPLGEGALDDYEVWLTPYSPGKKLDYYFRAELPDSTVLATFPENAESDGETLPFRFEGIPSAWVVILQQGFMVAALFTASLVMFSAFGLTANTPAIKLFGKQVLWTTVFMILGAGLFHIVLARVVHDGLGWGGWPIGEFNFGDTLTEIVIVYWIALNLLLRGSTFGSGESGNIISVGTARMLGIAGYVLVVVIFVVPQFLA